MRTSARTNVTPVGLAPVVRATAAVKARSAGVASKLEARFSRFVLGLVLSLFGSAAATWCFVHVPIFRHTEARIRWLKKRIGDKAGADAAERMAVSYLAARPRPKDYRTLLARAQDYPLRTATLSAAFRGIVAGMRPGKAALIGLAKALLERGDVDLVLELASASRPGQGGTSDEDDRIFESLFLESLNAGAAAPTGDLAARLTPPRCRHRLLVMHDLLSPAAMRHLAHGAERLTIIRFGDLYGKLDIDELRRELVGVDVNVEHARTRTDRFQQRYFDIHAATYEAAQDLGRAFIDANPWLEREVEDVESLESDLVLDLADKLFFKALRFDGINQAVKDPEFDNVIVSFGSSFEMYRLFFFDEATRNDPRILACCWSSDFDTHMRYPTRLALMRKLVQDGWRAPVLSVLEEAGEPLPPGAVERIPPLIAEFLETADQCPDRQPGASRPNRPTIAFVAHEGRAYGYNSVQIATRLQQDFNVNIIWVQGKQAKLAEHLAAARKDPLLQNGRKPPMQPGYVVVRPPVPNPATKREMSVLAYRSVSEASRWLLKSFEDDPVLSCALDAHLTTDFPAATLEILAAARTATALYQKYAYDLVAICPGRTPRAAQFANVARVFGIPSLTVEPHCLNAAYCRYTTVRTDFAAVYSDYYAEEYGRYFGIPADRCFPVGSPRVLQPAGYESEAFREAARARLGLGPDDPPIISFPTQPMPPAFILSIWQMVIQAAKSLGRPVKVFVKPHPEEGAGHIERYRRLIIDEGAEDICDIRSGDIKDMLLASHLVLTCYSVSGLEAVVLERNVAVVGREGVDYPTPYAEILGVPFCTTVEEVRTVIADALDSGRNAASAARRFKDANPYLFDNSTFERLRATVQEIIDIGPDGIRARDALPDSSFVTSEFREYFA